MKFTKKRHLRALFICLLFLIISSSQIYAYNGSEEGKRKCLFPGDTKYADILKMSPEWRGRLKELVLGFVEKVGLQNYLVDIGIVGTFAYGCARSPKDSDPSDIDIIIYLDVEKIKELPDSVLTKFFDYLPKGCNNINKKMNIDLAVDLLLKSSSFLDGQNGIYFSVLEDKMYGRDDGKPLFIKSIYFRKRWYNIPRDEYNKFKKNFRDTSVYKKIIGDNGKLQYIRKNTGELLLESK